MGDADATVLGPPRPREPPHYIDNRLAYRDPDERRFWDRAELDLDRILNTLGVRVGTGDRVVDIGCGVGRFRRALAARSREVIGLDISEAMLEQARRQNADLHNARWVRGDGRSLAGIPDGSMDACFSYVVFQHVPDPEITLGYVREMGRVLRPGGWAAFQVSNDFDLHRRWRKRPPRRLLGEAVALLRRRPRGQANAAWLGSAVELRDVETAANDAGLEIERVTGAGSQLCLILARRSTQV